MTVTAIDRTAEQRLASLDRANAIRFYRAALKRRMRAGLVDVAALVADPAPELQTMRVEKLLRAIPGWGATKTRKVLRELRISESKTLGGLSDRQRRELAARLHG